MCEMLQCCYRTIRLQNFKDIHNCVRIAARCTLVVIELLGYKISKTYTTKSIPGATEYGCYRTIRLQNFKDIHNR